MRPNHAMGDGRHAHALAGDGRLSGDGTVAEPRKLVSRHIAVYLSRHSFRADTSAFRPIGDVERTYGLCPPLKADVVEERQRASAG